MILVVSVSPDFHKLAWFCRLPIGDTTPRLAITFTMDLRPACLWTLGETIRILVWWIVIFRIEDWTSHFTTALRIITAGVSIIAENFIWSTWNDDISGFKRPDNRGGGVIPQKRTRNTHTRTRNDKDDAQHKQKKHPIGGGARSSGLRCRLLRLRINGGIHIHRAIVDFLLRHGFFEGVTTNGCHVVMLLQL